MTEQTQAPATRRVVTTDEKIAVLEARIAKDTQSLADLRAAASAAAAFANVGAGDSVSFKVGRAETRREITGQVIARGEVDGVDVVKVLTGTGIDTAVFQVKVSELTAVNPAAAASVEQAADQPSVDEDQAAVDDLLNNPLSADVEAALNAVQIG